MEALHSRRTYDYRIQEAICDSGDRELFPELNIPFGVAVGWSRSWDERAAGERQGFVAAWLIAILRRYARRYVDGHPSLALEQCVLRRTAAICIAQAAEVDETNPRRLIAPLVYERKVV